MNCKSKDIVPPENVLPPTPKRKKVDAKNMDDHTALTVPLQTMDYILSFEQDEAYIDEENKENELPALTKELQSQGSSSVCGSHFDSQQSKSSGEDQSCPSDTSLTSSQAQEYITHFGLHGYGSSQSQTSISSFDYDKWFEYRHKNDVKDDLN